MSDTITEHLIKEDLSISEFADEFCDIVEEVYGKHNYKTALNIINNRLSSGDNKDMNDKQRLDMIACHRTQIQAMKLQRNEACKLITDELQADKEAETWNTEIKIYQDDIIKLKAELNIS